MVKVPRLNEIMYLTVQVLDETKHLGTVLDERHTKYRGPHLKNKIKLENVRLHLFRPLLKSKFRVKH